MIESRFPLIGGLIGLLFCAADRRNGRQTILYINDMRDCFLFSSPHRGVFRRNLPVCQSVVHGARTKKCTTRMAVKH